MMRTNPQKNRPRTISRNSYAKVNLFLEVLGKRADGYHEIRTVFSEIDLHDVISFLLTKKGNVNVWSDKDLGDLSGNTVYRTALLMKERYGVKDGVDIKIKKSIPLSAGLGGGSSNAAVTIKELSLLWNLHLSEKEMYAVASEIGSDVSFFLTGGTALGESRGEKIRVLEPIEFEMLLLVKPGYGIRSGDAYQSSVDYGDNENWKYLLREKNPLYCFNRLEKSLLANYPDLREIIKHMGDNGAVKAIVSGSGSTVIGFYDDRRVFDKHYNYYKVKGFWCCQSKTKRR